MVRAIGFVLLLTGSTACASTNATSPSEAGTSDTATGEAGSLDGGGDGHLLTCSTPDECTVLGCPVCCAANACVLVSQVVNQLIQTPNYDQGCEKDTDCLALCEGDGCFVVAKPQTTSCTTSLCGDVDGGSGLSLCCVRGTCQGGSQCPGGDAGIGDARPGDGSGGDGRPTVCASGDDCMALGFPVCCLANACVSNPPNDLCSDAGVQLVQASSYDQSCKTDTDCVGIAEGNGCDVAAFNCPNAAINMGGYAQYQSDIAKTQSALCFAPSSCGSGFGPCCRGGKCEIFSGCSSPGDTLPACADAGGTCMPNVLSCGKAGPPDACAYSDEMCCVN